jgi:hypothetical protein
MTPLSNITLEGVAARIDLIAEAIDETLAAAAPALAGELLALGEAILDHWITAHAATPTAGLVEGFRLLALHRQAARGDPTFNACRESCRELVYYHNLVRLDPRHADVAHRLRLAAMVARHLALFIAGKLEVAGLGEFCCSSRPLRQREMVSTTAEPI